MAQFEVNLVAILDDVKNEIILRVIGSPPPPPAGYSLWFPETFTAFETTVPMRKNAIPARRAIYVVPDSSPTEWREVEYVNGAWQMPGVVIPDPNG